MKLDDQCNRHGHGSFYGFETDNFSVPDIPRLLVTFLHGFETDNFSVPVIPRLLVVVFYGFETGLDSLAL